MRFWINELGAWLHTCGQDAQHHGADITCRDCHATANAPRPQPPKPPPAWYGGRR